MFILITAGYLIISRFSTLKVSRCSMPRSGRLLKNIFLFIVYYATTTTTTCLPKKKYYFELLPACGLVQLSEMETFSWIMIKYNENNEQIIVSKSFHCCSPFALSSVNWSFNFSNSAEFLVHITKGNRAETLCLISHQSQHERQITVDFNLYFTCQNRWKRLWFPCVNLTVLWYWYRMFHPSLVPSQTTKRSLQLVCFHILPCFCFNIQRVPSKWWLENIQTGINYQSYVVVV